MAYVTPLMVCVVNETGFPLIVMLLSAPVKPIVGSMACRLRAPDTCLMVKLRVLAFHVREPNEEEFRPSSQVSSCNAEMMGTPRLWAELRMSGPIPG